MCGNLTAPIGQLFSILWGYWIFPKPIGWHVYEEWYLLQSGTRFKGVHIKRKTNLKAENSKLRHGAEAWTTRSRPIFFRLHELWRSSSRRTFPDSKDSFVFRDNIRTFLNGDTSGSEIKTATLACFEELLNRVPHCWLWFANWAQSRQGKVTQTDHPTVESPLLYTGSYFTCVRERYQGYMALTAAMIKLVRPGREPGVDATWCRFEL